MQWKNKNKVFEIGSTITEWDIRSADTSLCKEYGLLSDNQLAKLNALSKEKRNVAVGQMRQQSKEFNVKLEQCFDTIVEKFLEANNLDKDRDVIQINKDAVFVLNQNIKYPIFGAVEFRPKHTYNHFVRLGQFDFFLSDTEYSVKGLQEQQDLHKDGVIHLMRDLCQTCVRCNMDPKTVNVYLANLVLMYKKRNLAIEYYREFNTESVYRIFDGSRTLCMNEIDFDYIDSHGMMLDIKFNYETIILPLIRMLR